MATAKGTLRTCSKGHQYYKSSTCPVCPICEKEREPESELLAAVSAPARRALESLGIKTAKQLSNYTKAEILKLHGFGPASIPRLEKVLKSEGLAFKK